MERIDALTESISSKVFEDVKEKQASGWFEKNIKDIDEKLYIEDGIFEKVFNRERITTLSELVNFFIENQIIIRKYEKHLPNILKQVNYFVYEILYDEVLENVNSKLKG